MRVHCPKCATVFDVKNTVVLKAAGTITAKRRRRNGNTITSDEARAMQARSAEARKANREQQP